MYAKIKVGKLFSQSLFCPRRIRIGLVIARKSSSVFHQNSLSRPYSIGYLSGLSSLVSFRQIGRFDILIEVLIVIVVLNVAIVVILVLILFIFLILIFLMYLFF